VSEAAGSEPGFRGRAAKGVFWTATSNWGNELTRLLVFVILARLLDPKDFGLVALALVFIGMTQVVADQGMADALVQRKDLDPAHYDSAFWMNVAVGLFLAAIMAGLATPISLAVGEPRLAAVLAVLALSLPISSLNLVQRALMTRELAFRSLALRTLVSIGVGATIGVTAAFLGFGVWSLVAQHIAAPIAGVLVLWRVSDWRPRATFSYRHFKDLFGFGANVVGFRLLNYFTRTSDQLFIGSFLGAASLGFYTIGFRMLRLLFQVTSSLIDRVAFPLYSRLQGNAPRLVRAHYKSTAFAGLIAFPAFIGMAALAPDFVPVVFGTKWMDSVPIMQIFAFLGVVQFLTYLNGTMLKALGKPSWQVVIVAVTSVLKVVAFFIAVRFGIIAVAVASLCVGCVVAPAYYWTLHRLIPVRLVAYLDHIKGPLLASLFAGATMLGMRSVLGDGHALVTLLVASAVGLVAYVAAIEVVARDLAAEALDLTRRGTPSLRVLRPARGVAETNAKST
jgi:O-antigen/teichoic acid export membrane protein